MRHAATVCTDMLTETLGPVQLIKKACAVAGVTCSDQARSSPVRSASQMPWHSGPYGPPGTLYYQICCQIRSGFEPGILSCAALTGALEAYVRRAKRGAEDAALVTGTGKDLPEAIATQVHLERYGMKTSISNFPTLLGQVFFKLGLATPHDPAVSPCPMRTLLCRLFRKRADPSNWSEWPNVAGECADL